MAASLVGGAAIGAVFGELLKAVIDMRDRAVMFKPTLAYLTTTLTAIDPVIKEIEQQNNELGRANTELELLIKEMEEGTKLVYKCSKIHKLNFPARIRYQEQLVALVESLVRFFIIDMQAQTARDLKETLMKVRRIHSAVNKMQSNSNDEETGGGGIVSEDSDSGSANVAVEANQMDLTDETTVTIQQNDECVTEITNSVPVIANSVPETAVEPKILRNNSLEQVMEDLLHLVSQNKEKANNSQEEKHLTTIKSYDQSYPDRKRFMGTTKDRENPLDWDSRMKILLGVAKGLAHIHSLDGGNYVHGNIRSSNVLVTNDHQGCISDLSMTYSLSISFPQFRNTGYQDRDFCFGRKEKVNVLTQKCDVYSFGVLLFEMLTGRVPSEYNDALPWDVYLDVKDGIPVFDSAIGDNIQDAWKMKELADECASLVPSKSPSMDEVVRRMEKIRAS
nr:probable inactive receptor kinase At5g53320 isoform X2 [Arachis hypogaea]